MSPEPSVSEAEEVERAALRIAARRPKGCDDEFDACPGFGLCDCREDARAALNAVDHFAVVAERDALREALRTIRDMRCRGPQHDVAAAALSEHQEGG